MLPRLLQVKCDLGTDCSDCGAFTHTVHRRPDSTSPQPVPRPIDMLVKRGIQVRFMPYSNRHSAQQQATHAVYVDKCCAGACMRG